MDKVREGEREGGNDTGLRAWPYLGCETKEPFGLNHLLQHVALDPGRAVVVVHHSVLQVHVVHRQTDVILLAVNESDGVELIHDLCNT